MARPNLILLTVECWRNDHFGAMTPNLARLGEESAVFQAAYASGGWTLPSMTALMSSAYASMFGGGAVSLATPERQTLAECLMDGGYWTAGCVANPVCGISNGFHRGFGKFRDERRKPALVPGEQPGETRDWRRMVEKGISPRDLDTFCDAAYMTDLGLKWVEMRKTGEPYFLWLHYMDPHWPCLTPAPPADQQQLYEAWHDREIFNAEVIPRKGRYDPGEKTRLRWIERYRLALGSADREIGRLLDGLRTRPDWNSTVVAAIGDHGEEFFEHGAWHHSWNRLYREGIHVPLIVRVPGVAPLTLTQPVSNLDIAPTILDYAGAGQRSGGRRMMGRSLRPLIEGVNDAPRPIYSEMMNHRNSFSYLLAILDDSWKYIYDIDDPHRSKLFHIASDPGEENDLREKCPGVFRRFERMRLSHASLGLTRLMQRRDLEAKNDLDMDETMKEQMIALGYLAPT